MAEILVTMAVGPLLSMVKEKASSYLLEQYKVMEGMEEQHEVLKRKLPAILDVIADAEMQATEHREGAKAWLQAVRKVAYQGNDVFDEFKYEALRRKAKKEGHYRKLGMDVIKLFPTHNRIVFRYRMGNKLRFILQAIEVLITEMNAFRFKFRPQQQLSMKWRQTDSKIVDPMEIAGKSRAEDKKRIVDTLLEQKNNVDLTVLPIFGMGGLGKTTLAQLIYNDSKIQEHFQPRLWVCVSDNFDVDYVARNIVEAATNSTVMIGKSPLNSLREVVSGKRYLLVLDDIWNRDASQWEKLKSCLQHGGMGSSVLTTTRDQSIAQLMGTIKTNELSQLDQSSIEEIIKAKAFISKDISSDNTLVGMVGDMAKKCVGSPLAATALGSVLGTKTSVEEWEAILSRSTICDDEIGILPILKLSYNDLSSQMRQCFSFCAMFPKDYEINMEDLIRLWMANGLILEEQGARPEIRGKQIFTELASRSFFQEVKEVPFDESNNRYGRCFIITCKIHDLMHDVAQLAMGKECATVATESSKSEDFPYSTRHLFVPRLHMKTVLNGFLKKSSPSLQTLVYATGGTSKELQFLSRYNSIRALKIRKYSSFLNPKYLHHLRYLDLSESCITSLPEDISILYHLQTLNLSCCYYLTQLPKGMKYMTALRHLDTHGCYELKMMPPELRCLTSLQTLTYFAVGTSGPSCSGIGELGLLDDLGGRLEVHQLENVTETDAQAAKLGKKKRLTELTFIWSEGEETTLGQHGHNKVLESLEPHEGIKVLRVYSYCGSTFPAWMNNLHHVVELFLCECKNIKKLPPLWRLPALQILCISGTENLQCFCCGGDPPYTFKKLKALSLDGMPNLVAWWDINEVQGQEPMFPEVEILSISNCRKLTALPRASAIEESSGGVVDTTVWRPACPALMELTLEDLTAFQRWEADGGTIGEHAMTFVSLEQLYIKNCPELTTLPEAPKLNTLHIVENVSQQIVLHATRYITSLSTLKLSVDDRGTTLLIDHSSEPFALRVLGLRGGCGLLFPQSSAPVLWNCFVQLEDLEIVNCNALEQWPENVFQLLVSLRRLSIFDCERLTGRTQQAAEQPSPERNVLPSRLEFLGLEFCGSLVEVPILPVSLRELRIGGCDKLESVVLRGQHEDTSLGGGEGVPIRQEDSAMIPGPSTTVPEVPNLSPFTMRSSFCSNLLSVQLDCIESLHIYRCKRLKSVDGDLPSLEHLLLSDCCSLVSIPDGPQAYTSLRYLEIQRCPRLKVLPTCIKQRLNDIEETDVDACYTETRLSRSWKRVIGRNC